MQGKLIIVSGPSGTGKTTVVHDLLDQFAELAFSISATTRSMRSDEKDGQDYYFLDKADFEARINDDAFLEYEEVYKDLYYGTLMEEIQRIWDMQQIPVLDIDVKGALNIKKHFRGDPLLIFIHPGSKENLEERLNARGTEKPEKVQKRLDKADFELSAASEFHHVLYNYRLSETQAKTRELVKEYLIKAKAESQS